MATIPDTDGWKDIAGTPYMEFLHKGKIERELTKESATRVFKIRWQDLKIFTDKMLGFTKQAGGAGGITITHPTQVHPILTSLRARRATVEGIITDGDEGNGNSLAFQYAKVTILYETGDFAIFSIEDTEVDVVSETLTLGASFVQLPDNAFVWKTTGTTIREGLGKLIPENVYHIPLRGRRSFNKSAIQANIGKVNSVVYRGFKEQTVLYLGASVVNNISGSENSIDIVHNFKVRPTSPHWNQGYNPATANWDLVLPPPYDMVDFAAALNV